VSDRATEFRAFYKAFRISHQRAFYDDRRREYERAHQQAIGVRSVLLGLAAAAGIAGAIASGTGRAALAVGAAVAAALAGAVTAYDALIGFAPLTKLYHDAALNLANIEVDWDASASDLDADVERVEQIFRAENGQWGQLVVQGVPKDTAVPDNQGG
jgi:hypothetical protein